MLQPRPSIRPYMQFLFVQSGFPLELPLPRFVTSPQLFFRSGIPHHRGSARTFTAVRISRRSYIENLSGAIREILQKSNPRLHGFHDHMNDIELLQCQDFFSKKTSFKVKSDVQTGLRFLCCTALLYRLIMNRTICTMITRSSIHFNVGICGCYSASRVQLLFRTLADTLPQRKGLLTLR